MLPILFLLFCQDAKTIDLATLESEVIKARNPIKSGEIEITSRSKTVRDRKAAPEESGYTWKLAMSGKKLRGEYGPSNIGYKSLGIINCEKSGYCFSYDGNGQSSHAEFGSFEKDIFLVRRHPFRYVVPLRLLGVNPLPNLSMGLLDESKTIFNDQFLDKAKYTINFEGDGEDKKCIFKGRGQSNVNDWNDPYLVTVVVLPNKGWNIISLSKTNSKNRINIDINLSKVNDIWFPKKMTYTYQVLEGDWLVKDEGLNDIHIKSLNSPLDETLFTRAGVNMKRGTIIREENTLFYWIDNKKVPYKDYWKEKANALKE